MVLSRRRFWNSGASSNKMDKRRSVCIELLHFKTNRSTSYTHHYHLKLFSKFWPINLNYFISVMVMKQVKTTKFNQQKSSSSASNGHYDNHRYSNSSNGSRFSEPANNSTIFISSSFMLMIIMASFYILLFCSSQPGSLVQAQPLEIHSPYNHRSAMNTLKELDKYYSQKARPR